MTQVSDLSNWEDDGSVFCNECRGRNRFGDDGMLMFGPVHCPTLSHEPLCFGSRPLQLQLQFWFLVCCEWVSHKKCVSIYPDFLIHKIDKEQHEFGRHGGTCILLL